MTTHVLYSLRMKSPYLTVDDIPAVPSLTMATQKTLSLLMDVAVRYSIRLSMLFSGAAKMNRHGE